MNFFTKMLVKKQLKGKVPEGEMDKMIDLIEQNPDFFKNMAESIQEKMKSGMSQEEAALAVMQKDGDQLKQLMRK
ncbi:MAG: hypothetical protein RLY66_673 [Candidatus Parcubacteria bacterium]|jgi:hypothetical protein